VNRAERRKLKAQQGSAEMRRAKWRCLGCERAGYRKKSKSKEHFWPLWLTERANIKGASLNWVHGKAHRNATVLPLCSECNDILNTKLEIPVQHVFDSVENKEGLSDYDAKLLKLLIRWLWKYEGLDWSLMASGTDARYSSSYTMIERVLGASMEEHRDRLMLAITLVKSNEGFEDWPVGIDSPTMPFNSVFVSGVFCRLAIMAVSVAFQDKIPLQFLRIRLKKTPTFDKEYFPLEGFETCSDAVFVTRNCSYDLAESHDQLARSTSSEALIIARPRVELP
jgi:hypothetical protein